MPAIIGLMGEKETGKDTIADYFVENFNAAKLHFADPLKEACKAIFDLADWEMNTPDGKAATNNFWGVTNREILQGFGTDVCRSWKPDIWLQAFYRRLSALPLDQLVIVADCRFKNEKAFIEELGGEVWRLIRTDRQDERDRHPSEIEMQSIPHSQFPVVIAMPTGVPGLIKVAHQKYVARRESKVWPAQLPKPDFLKTRFDNLIV
jgi:hypothetical protein